MTNLKTIRAGLVVVAITITDEDDILIGVGLTRKRAVRRLYKQIQIYVG